MGEIKENICRLCLKYGDDTFSDFSDLSSKEKLKTVLPELNVNNPTDFVICSDCRKSLEESHQLTKTFSKNDNFIRTEKDYLKIVNKINLNRIVNNTGSEDSKNTSKNICRICLKSNCDKYTSLNKASSDKFFSNILGTCLSKLDQDLTLNPVICKLCHNRLRDMFTFKSKCMSVEKKVVQYSETTSEKQIDLNKVLDFINGTEANDDKEIVIKDEDMEEDSNLSNLQNAEINKKRPLAEEPCDVIPPKKQKSVNTDSKDNGEEATQASESSKTSVTSVPHFGFGYKLMYEPKNIAELEEWLSKVDTLKRENNWTDIMTIGKVLEKLKGMNEMYIWFSNISKIFTWEEWKKKLLQVFPGQNDYCNLLKTMVNRKKRPTETFVEYYNAKLATLQPMNITGERAVSCLIGGISDIVIGCVARAGNYKTPEELLLYFKTCDSKKSESPPKNHNKSRENVQGIKPQNRKRAQCHSCNEYGHLARNCRKALTLKPNILAPEKCKEIESQGKGARNMEHRTLEHNSVDPQQKKDKDLDKKPRTDKAEEFSTTRDKAASALKPQEHIEGANSKTFGTSPGKSVINIISVVKLESPIKHTSAAKLSKQDEKTSTSKKESNSTEDKSNTVKQDKEVASSAKPQVQSSGSSAVISSTTPESKRSNSDVPKAKIEVNSNVSKAQKVSDKSTYAAKQEYSRTQSQERVKPDATHQPQRKANVGAPRDKTDIRPLAENKSNNESKSVAPVQKQNRTVEQSEKSSAESPRQSKGRDFTAFAKPFAPGGGNYMNRVTSSATSRNEKKGERGGGYNRSASAATPQDRRNDAYRGVPRDGPQEARGESYVNKGASDIWPQERKNTSYVNRDIKEKMSSFEPPQQREGSYNNRGDLSVRSRQQVRVDSFKGEDYYTRRDTSNTGTEKQTEGSYIRRYLLESGLADQFETTNRRASSGNPDMPREESYKDRGTLGGQMRAGNRGESSVLTQDVEEISYAERIRLQALIEGGNVTSGVGEKERYIKGILKTRSSVSSEGGSANTDSPGGGPQKEWQSSYVDKSVSDVVAQTRDKDDNINKGAPSASKLDGEGMEGRYSNRGTSNVGVDQLMDRSHNTGEPITAAPQESGEGSRLNKTTLGDGAASRSAGSYFNRSISSTRLLGSGLGSLFSLSLATRPFARDSSFTGRFATGARPQGSSDSYLNRGGPSARLPNYDEGNRVAPVGRFYESSESTYTRRSSYGGRAGEPTSNNYYNRNSPVAGHQEQSHREMCLRCYTIGHNTADCPRYRT